jgi:Mg/Co/Ni transporter MgtE
MKGIIPVNDIVDVLAHEGSEAIHKLAPGAHSHRFVRSADS